MRKSPASIPGIYLITNRITGVVYVGQAVNIRKRWEVHRSKLARGKHGNLYLQRAWIKYGAEAFEFSILRDLSSIQPERLAGELNEAEIAALLERPENYNLAKAGESGFIITEETRALLAAKSIARWSDDEYKQKLANAIRATLNEPEARAKRSAAISEGQSSPEYKSKRSEISKRLWADPEFRSRMAEEKRANWADPEYRAKQSEGRKKSWADPEIRTRRIEALTASANDPDIMGRRTAAVNAARSQINEKHRLKWQDPEYRARQSASRSDGQKARFVDPEARAKQSEIARASWAKRRAKTTAPAP